MHVDKILKLPTKVLLIAIFNSDITNDNSFKIVSRFLKTKWSNEILDNNYYEFIKTEMSKHFGIEFILNKTEIFFSVKNFQNISYDEYINKLYFEIISRIS